jgi:hypothetical protein
MSLASLSAGWNTYDDVPKPSNKRIQQPATTTLQQLVIHKNTNLTPAKVAQMPKGRYNYTSRMLLAI